MDRKSALGELTAFGASAESLRKEYGKALLDPAEFQRKLSRCELTCRGMCCYGGVSVDQDTADVLRRLAKERKSDFQKMGLKLADPVVAPAEWQGVVSNITALKPRSFKSRVKDYPDHFGETACTFLMEDARCGLQVLSEMDGQHRWFYKPFSCWLLPIKLWKGAIRLFDKMTDPFVYPDYPGFISRTFCGRTDACGEAAAKRLAPELDHLGKILDRDLLGELGHNDRSAAKTAT